MFRHKAHVGWDQDGGFSQKTYDGDPMDDSVRDLLRAAGENPDMMTKEDIDFSRKFITGYQKLPQPFIPQATPISQRFCIYICILYICILYLYFLFKI